MSACPRPSFVTGEAARPAPVIVAGKRFRFSFSSTCWWRLCICIFESTAVDALPQRRLGLHTRCKPPEMLSPSNTQEMKDERRQLKQATHRSGISSSLPVMS